MGILNLMPNSFSPVGRMPDTKDAIAYAHQMVRAGAAIIDVGAEPTHPLNNTMVTEEQELSALIPVIKILSQELQVPISVDTSRPRIMEAVIHAGAHMINDVRALRVPGAREIVADLDVPICLMHMRHFSLPGHTEILHSTSKINGSILQEISHFFDEQLLLCDQAGIARNRLLLDPGIGAGSFGKNLQENIQLINQLDYFKRFNLPLHIGVSRKTFLGELLNVSVEKRFAGSISAALMAARQGANIIRVHDVEATIHALKVMHAIDTSEKDPVYD